MTLALRLLWVFGVVLATFVIHEAAHGFMGAALGYDMVVRLNGATPRDAAGLLPWQRDLISAAGPMITVVQGFLAARLAAVWHPAFTIALTALMMRCLAAGASLRNPNDEARLGLSWDFGYWTVHVIVIGVLALAVLFAARAARPGWRSSAVTALIILCGLTFVVAINGLLPAVLFPAL